MTVVIRLPFTTPPLRSNDRPNRWAKAATTKMIREAGKLCALRDMPHAITGQVRVVFVWEVTDKRIRDTGASSPTLKAALDGIVDAGRLLADNSRIVVEEACRIEVGTQRGCRVEIEEIA